MNNQPKDMTAEEYYEQNIDATNIPREHYEREIIQLMREFANQEKAKMFSREQMIQLANAVKEACAEKATSYVKENLRRVQVENSILSIGVEPFINDLK